MQNDVQCDALSIWDSRWYSLGCDKQKLIWRFAPTDETVRDPHQTAKMKFLNILVSVCIRRGTRFSWLDSKAITFLRFRRGCLLFTNVHCLALNRHCWILPICAEHYCQFVNNWRKYYSHINVLRQMLILLNSATTMSHVRCTFTDVYLRRRLNTENAPEYMLIMLWMDTAHPSSGGGNHFHMLSVSQLW